MTEFFDAIKAGEAARVSQLLDEDPSLLRSSSNNTTPILTAIYHGKRDIADLLVQRGAQLSFHEAAALGDLDKVRSMLAADRTLLDRRSSDGFPPLGLAIFFRHPEVARYLIEQGADVNAAAENPQRVTPLHAAAAVADRATVALLLERGANPNVRQQSDYTPLHGAASRGDVEIAKLLLNHGADGEAKGSDGLTVEGVATKYGQGAFAEWWRSERH